MDVGVVGCGGNGCALGARGSSSVKHISLHSGCDPPCPCSSGTALGRSYSPNMLNGSWTRQAADSGVARCQRPAFWIRCLSSPRVRLERNPNSAVPETPIIHTGVPHDLSPRCPRRWRWHRPRPRRRTIAGRAAVVVVPVTAVVPVRVVAPAPVPIVARAPVMVVRGCGRRHRLRGAGGQSESRCGDPAGRQCAGAQAKPRSWLRAYIHVS
jgi:hypothetical protein